MLRAWFQAESSRPSSKFRCLVWGFPPKRNLASKLAIEPHVGGFDPAPTLGLMPTFDAKFQFRHTTTLPPTLWWLSRRHKTDPMTIIVCTIEAEWYDDATAELEGDSDAQKASKYPFASLAVGQCFVVFGGGGLHCRWLSRSTIILYQL